MPLTKVSFSMIEGAFANVLDYGADPTGLADSSSAIQAAMDSDIGTVYLPAGTYKLNTGLVFNKACTFVGASSTGSGVAGESWSEAGDQTTVLNYTGSGIAIISNISTAPSTQSANIHLSNFVLVGTSAATGGILFGNTTLSGSYFLVLSSITNVLVKEFTKTGAYGVAIARCYMSNFKNLTCRSNYDGLWIGKGSQADTSSTTSILIESCAFNNNTRYGIDLHDVTGITMVSPVCEANGSSAINAAPNDVSCTIVNVFGLYTESNCLTTAAPIINIDHTGAGSTLDIKFFGGEILEYVGVAPSICSSLIYFGTCSYVKFNNFYTAGLAPGQLVTGGNAFGCYFETWGGQYVADTHVTGNTADPIMPDFYRVRLMNNQSNIIVKKIGSADPAIPQSISVTGNIKYSGYLNQKGSFSYNNGTNNSTGLNVANGVQIVKLEQSPDIGATYSMIIGNSGGGAGAAVSIFDPDAGTFTYGGASPAVSFTVVGTGGNTYTLTVESLNGTLQIQRTAGTAPYTLSVFRLF